ncbi:MAG TPA: heme lyase CcmF/NrfE family subunit [Candidatus Acidoferrales bacterium]|nr:heme lyase CcmF/NrfE family subunit [Candidatus Acidoferrales bacterium]
MDLFGSFALLLAFACAVYAIVAGIIAIRTRNPLIQKSARHAGIAVCLLVMIGAASLLYLFLTDDFSVSYVASHSNRDLETFFKVAALWSGQEGSLLFWSLILSIYTFFVLFTNRGKHPELMPYVGVILASVQTFFLALNVFVVSPFQVLGTAGANGLMRLASLPDGSGLNPLLQYPEMVAHPPTLYTGYVGFTIPFAFALAALLGRYPGEKWIHITRKWTMIAWCFQSAGILMGAHWAYAVLGWGGYWGWDPVENASLMPWLTGTAFLHSVMMQEKRGMLKVWNVWLVFTTFLLCILGTFLTRSGVVSSVHAFAQSAIGPWFVGFILLTLAVCSLAFFKNRDYLKSDNQLDSMVSRESSFLFNNLILLAACFAVLWGTLFPVISEWVQGSKISVGPPFFNKVNIPIGLFLLFLTGVGPLLAWRRTSLESLKRNFGWPLAAGLVAGAIAWPLGFSDIFAVTCLILSVFVTLTIFGEFFRGAKVISSRTGMNIFSSVGQLTMRNTRRYGGYVVHFGIVLIFIGISGAAFNRDQQMEMGPGSRMEIRPYTLNMQMFEQRPAKNYTAERATVEVLKNGQPLVTLFPEKRFFPSNEMSGTMVAIYSTLKEDLYVVYAGRSPENNQPIIHVYLNPLVKWIWLGGLIVVMGTGLALLPNRQPVLALKSVAETAPPAVAEPAPHSLLTRSGSHGSAD